MASNFSDLAELAEEETELTPEQQLEVDLRAKQSIDKIFYDVYNSTEGRIMFDYLKERYLDIMIAHPGDDMSQIYTRQGKANLVRDMINSANELSNGR